MFPLGQSAFAQAEHSPLRAIFFALYKITTKKTDSNLLDTRNLWLHSTSGTTAFSQHKQRQAGHTHLTTLAFFRASISTATFENHTRIAAAYLDLSFLLCAPAHGVWTHLFLTSSHQPTAAKSYGKKRFILFCNHLTSRSATRIWRKPNGLGVLFCIAGRKIRYSERCFLLLAG